MEQILGGLFNITLIVILTIGIFMACREVVCWYGKINERLELEKKRNIKLDEIAGYLKSLTQIEVNKKKECAAQSVVTLTDEVAKAPIKNKS